MTSDAKIGLLLGLIFIFIIAFILNGLPGLHSRNSSNQATAQDLTNLSSSSSDTPPVQPTGVASSLGAPTYRSDENVRYRMPLGGTNTTEATASIAPAADKLDVSNEAVSGSEPTNKSTSLSDVSLVDISNGEETVTPERAVSADSGTVATGGFAAEGAKVTTEYVIQSGDTPAKIATKFYGPEEGNRLANIEKLMDANKITDATKLKVGKKLVIPALSNGPEKLAALNPDSFVKVEPRATRSAAPAKVDAKNDTKTVSAKEYVVVKGDSLWTISAKALGSGSRYKEILKLNGDQLGNDGSKLAVGMKLRIPGQ